MDLIDRIRALATKAENQKAMLLTEEATKNALVMPFIQALGYDVFCPNEVTPELCADVGVKKGEKVDYAILRDGKPVILFECKAVGANLNDIHASQLYCYFSVTDARVGVVTNGVDYRFFSDLESSNKMDDKPFLEFSILDFPEAILPELKKFTKGAFDLQELLNSASELKYTREIKTILAGELAKPSEDFVRFFAAQIYSGKITQAIKDQFAPITRRAMLEFINERISEKLKTVLVNNQKEEDEVRQSTAAITTNVAAGSAQMIVTTPEETEAFHIVKSILREVVDSTRIIPRDTQSYFGVLLDDNNRKPLCRFHFNRAQKYLGLIGADKTEQRIPIGSLDEIYKYAEQLRAAVQQYECAS